VLGVRRAALRSTVRYALAAAAVAGWRRWTWEGEGLSEGGGRVRAS
jgi:hypothetical protein